jgi:uncharacterized protein YkwD
LLRQSGVGRNRRLLILLLAVAVLALTVLATSSSPPAHAKNSARLNVSRLIAPESVCPTEAAVRKMNRATKAMACMTNYARRKAGLRKLHVLKSLNHSAKMKSRDMLRCDTFAHTVCGKTVLYWFKRVGYTGKVCREISENIAWGAGALANTRNIFRALMYSSPHRHTILSRKYTSFGNGVMRGNMKGVRGAGAWTQHFGGTC